MKTKLFLSFFLSFTLLQIASYSGSKNTNPPNTNTPAQINRSHPDPDWQISVDALFWRAYENRLQYATKPSDIDETSDFTKGHLIKPHFKWHTGFREKFAYEPLHRTWDLYFQWTQITNRATGRVIAPGNEVDAGDGFGFYPVWHLDPNAMVTDFALTGREIWKLTTNVVDGVWGYHFDWASWFRLTARAGARGAFLSQSVTINYTGGIFPSGRESTLMHNNFRGGGPLVQLDPEFYLTKNKNLSLYFSGAAAMLLGKMVLKEKAVTYFTFAHPGIHKHLFRVRWVVDCLAGVRFRIPFARNRYALTFKGGWEFHDFFRQFLLPSPPLNLLHGNRDLLLFGWFASSQFEF